MPEGDEGARLGLLVPMAQALGYSGRLDQARDALEEVLVLLPPDQVAVRGQVAAAAARVDQLIGRHEGRGPCWSGRWRRSPTKPRPRRRR